MSEAPPESVLLMIDEDLDRADAATAAIDGGGDFLCCVQASLGFRYRAEITHQVIFGTPLDEQSWRASRPAPVEGKPDPPTPSQGEPT